MEIDKNTNTIDFKNTLLFVNKANAITIVGGDTKRETITIKGVTVVGRKDKSKIITKLKWIMFVIKFKI
ncbi:MAG: hypothetical protein ACRCVJ_12010 [Clostridium sp.]|uniref:hypothetical protein n=1 Tax=Clostridium sp. TaxID=1506 RepID=UPI003F384E35